MLDAMQAVETIAKEQGAQLLGWRELPVNPEGLGNMALDAMPYFLQPFFAAEGKVRH